MMRTPLEKAHRDPESMKAKILTAARRIFGEYGFHGTTTRMIAKEVGIDISTLHYHWGEKKDLYEAVILDVNRDLGQQLGEVEKIVHGRPLADLVPHVPAPDHPRPARILPVRVKLAPGPSLEEILEEMRGER